MAIVLFKKGGFKICNEFSFEHELDTGWSFTKEPLKEVAKEPIKEIFRQPLEEVTKAVVKEKSNLINMLSKNRE